MGDFRISTTNYVLNLFCFLCCFCFALFCFMFVVIVFGLFVVAFFFGYDILQSFTQEFHAVSRKNFTQFHARISVVGNVSPGDQCLEAITSPQNYERLHKTCIHKVQFVHFLIAYLGLVIRFVNLPINAVDRKPQFVAG